MQPPNGDILNSWKDIASYLGRSRRTVQRWECDLALPVRRPRGKRRSTVFAVREEIDVWVKTCPQALAGREDGSPRSDPANELRNNILASRVLRDEARSSRRELRVALHALLSNLRRLETPFAPDETVTAQASSAKIPKRPAELY